MATIYQAMGIDPSVALADFSGRPQYLLDDPAPIPDDYDGGSFKTREDYLDYRKSGSLMLSGEVGR